VKNGEINLKYVRNSLITGGKQRGFYNHKRNAVVVVVVVVVKA
jgi:hypothetical protein